MSQFDYPYDPSTLREPKNRMAAAHFATEFAEGMRDNPPHEAVKALADLDDMIADARKALDRAWDSVDKLRAHVEISVDAYFALRKGEFHELSETGFPLKGDGS